MPTYIIEHLEPELFEWCIIEYEYISEIVGKQNLIFTNIKNNKDKKKLQKHGDVFLGKFFEFSSKNFLGRICILDADAKKTLTTNDKKDFNYFVFGGILGDNPPHHRTKKLIDELKYEKIQFETRNLGRIQMPTDTAVYVTKKILEGKKFREIEFFDNVEIEINEGESILLPYRYAVENEKIVMSGKLFGYLKRKEGL